MVRVMLGVRMVLLIGVPLLAWLYQTRVMYMTFPAPQSNQSAVFITGASSGIGRSVAQQLANEGWTVFATVRSDKDMKQLRQLNVSTLQPIMMDVTNQTSVERAVEEVELLLRKSQLKLAAIVNNAGVNLEYGRVRRAKAMEYDPHKLIWPAKSELIDSTMQVNLIGMLRVTELFLPLIKRDQGRVINIGSYFGSFAPMGLMQLGYSASKHAVEAISDGQRRGLAAQGVSVSLIKPGNFKTQMNTVGDDPAQMVDAVRDALSHSQPLPRYYVGSILGVPCRLVCMILGGAPEWLADKYL